MQDPKSKGKFNPVVPVRCPIKGVKASWTKAFDANKAPKGPLSFSKFSNLRCRGLNELIPYPFCEKSELLASLENK